MKKYLCLALFASIALGDELSVLSNTKQNIIDLQKKQIKEKKISNKYDWLSDITFSGSVTKDNDKNTTNDYSLSFSQNIFKFGGITSQMKYAKELEKMELINLDKSTKEDLSTIFSLLIDIRLNENSIEQNILNLENSNIEIRNKKSEYNAGELGISDLNDAIMTKNNLNDTKEELKLTKLVNLNSLKKYTSKNYKSIDIPNIKLMSKESFLEKATAIKYAKSDVKVNNELYNIEKSDYLPSLSVNGNYGYNDSSSSKADDYYTYGLKITMPFSYTASNNIEQKRLDYLISKQELNDEIRSSELSYEEVLLSIKAYKQRIKLAKQDIKLYDELLEVNTQEYEAGYKTLDDVETINNSKKIRMLDIKNYELNIQKQIINLYFKI